jgi:hypothetical protein
MFISSVLHQNFAPIADLECPPTLFTGTFPLVQCNYGIYLCSHFLSPTNNLSAPPRQAQWQRQIKQTSGFEPVFGQFLGWGTYTRWLSSFVYIHLLIRFLKFSNNWFWHGPWFSKILISQRTAKDSLLVLSWKLLILWSFWQNWNRWFFDPAFDSELFPEPVAV